MMKKHTKPNPQAGVTGGIVEQEAPIQASNLAVYNSKSGKGERVGYRVEDGKKSAYLSRPAIWLTPDQQGREEAIEEMTALKQKYRSEIVPQLQSELGLKNVMAVPRISKITLNMGVGEAVGDKKVLEHAVSDMEKIAGQKPIVTKSRKSIAGFKIRDGWPIGCKVTCATSACTNSLIA